MCSNEGIRKYCRSKRAPLVDEELGVRREDADQEVSLRRPSDLGHRICPLAGIVLFAPIQVMMLGMLSGRECG
jgi:hypothetical protein